MTEISEPLKNEIKLLAKIVDYAFGQLFIKCPYHEDSVCLHNKSKGIHCCIYNCPLIDQEPK